ncbi:SLAM family member 8-like [Pogoniulus pusillus]|uniref:SLAM family member 8-like n=1 Tax=Pogoniulus pusillus TaxID=488313 RepID=UPI0030B95014
MPPTPPGLLLLALVVAGPALPWQGAAAKPQAVEGALGGSVLLCPLLPPNKTVKAVEWSFSDGSGANILLAELGPGGFHRPEPQDRFQGRLELVESLALRIWALQRGDTGTYQARVKLVPALLEDHSFHLSVRGPVPVPRIQHQLLSLTTQGCNISLRCWVPADSDAKVAWQQGAPWGQLGEDNQTLHLAVPSSALDASYTCVAWNSIQQQNISAHLGSLCQPLGTGGWFRWHLCLVVLGLLLGTLLGIFCLWRKKMRKKRPREASMDAPQELSYALVQRANTSGTAELPHSTTIYSQVQSRPMVLT